MMKNELKCYVARFFTHRSKNQIIDKRSDHELTFAFEAFISVNLNFTLTLLGYLYPALNNPVQIN